MQCPEILLRQNLEMSSMDALTFQIKDELRFCTRTNVLMMGSVE
ncbi:hypothetical protein FDUTEX481_02683 [Tolypothrix sp. PCC 7601]|nr:hypothetical protein FDUTEX481_02683 [Tolypothrix sp. PCC 7601]